MSMSASTASAPCAGNRPTGKAQFPTTNSEMSSSSTNRPKDDPAYSIIFNSIFPSYLKSSYLTVLYAIKQFIASKSTNPINSPIIALAEKESYFSYISRRCLDCPFFLYYINSNSCASHYQPILTKLQSGMESNTCPETNSPPCSNYQPGNKLIMPLTIRNGSSNSVPPIPKADLQIHLSTKGRGNS